MVLSRPYLKSLQSLPEKLQERITAALSILKTSPYFHRHVKKLHSPYESSYRLRVGSLRVVYRVLKPSQEVLVLDVEWRGSVY